MMKNWFKAASKLGHHDLYQIQVNRNDLPDLKESRRPPESGQILHPGGLRSKQLPRVIFGTHFDFLTRESRALGMCDGAHAETCSHAVMQSDAGNASMHAAGVSNECVRQTLQSWVQVDVLACRLGSPKTTKPAGCGLCRVLTDFVSFVRWLRGQDLNLRPLGYEPNELPDCSTPRLSR